MKIVDEKITIDDGLSFRVLSDLADGLTFMAIDIETTGLSPGKAMIYLIGLAKPEGDSGVISLRQFFAEKPEEERDILTQLLDDTSPCDCLAHFNGNRFDIPFIKERLIRSGLASDPEYSLLTEQFFKKRCLDYYPLIKPYKRALGLPDCRQQSIERLIQTEREDSTSGKELISLYLTAGTHGDPDAVATLLKHNRDDVVGLCLLSRIFSFTDFVDLVKHAAEGGESPFEIMDIKKNSYLMPGGEDGKELIVSLDIKKNISINLPAPFTTHRDGLYLVADASSLRLRIPLITDEMKLFYRDHRNYYYLPAEDMAIHKSVSQFVDRSRRQPATAETCYTRAYGEFIPVFTGNNKSAPGIIAPLLQKEYGDSRRFIIYKKETDMNAYLVHALSHILYQ